MKILGIIPIVIGGLMTIITGFNLVTEKEVADVGPIEVTKEEETAIYWSPVLGGILLVSGIIITIAAKGKST